MRAAVYHGRGDVRVEEVPIPRPGPGDVRLQVTGVGICGTDVGEYIAGPAMFPVHAPHAVTGHVGPMIPGHEFAGVVDAVGADVDGFAIGDRVFSPGAIACEQCERCRAGRTNLCERYVTVGLHRDGALAEYVVVPERWCYRVPPELDDRVAPLAQPMAIAVHAMRRGLGNSPARAIVVGCGGIGAFLIYALARSGCDVVAVDPALSRLTVAWTLGARGAVTQLGGERAPLVFEVSGTQAGLDAALAAVTSGGRVVTVGLMKERANYDVRDATLREIEIIGTNALVADRDVPEALLLLAEDPALWSLVAPRTIPLERLVEDGLRPMAEHRAEAIKTIIDPRA